MLSAQDARYFLAASVFLVYNVLQLGVVGCGPVRQGVLPVVFTWGVTHFLKLPEPVWILLLIPSRFRGTLKRRL